MKLCGLTCKSPSVCQFYSMLWLLYVCLNFKYLNWTRAGTRCSDIFFVSQRANQLRVFIFGMGRIDFAHIRMLQSYNFLWKKRYWVRIAFYNALPVSLNSQGVQGTRHVLGRAWFDRKLFVRQDWRSLFLAGLGKLSDMSLIQSSVTLLLLVVCT